MTTYRLPVPPMVCSVDGRAASLERVDISGVRNPPVTPDPVSCYVVYQDNGQSEWVPAAAIDGGSAYKDLAQLVIIIP